VLPITEVFTVYENPAGLYRIETYTFDLETHKHDDIETEQLSGVPWQFWDLFPSPVVPGAGLPSSIHSFAFRMISHLAVA
jgi:hypothetical protein